MSSIPKVDAADRTSWFTSARDDGIHLRDVTSQVVGINKENPVSLGGSACVFKAILLEGDREQLVSVKFQC